LQILLQECDLGAVFIVYGFAVLPVLCIDGSELRF
jgi:hypothetical protein